MASSKASSHNVLGRLIASLEAMVVEAATSVDMGSLIELFLFHRCDRCRYPLRRLGLSIVFCWWIETQLSMSCKACRRRIRNLQPSLFRFRLPICTPHPDLCTVPTQTTREWHLHLLLLYVSVRSPQLLRLQEYRRAHLCWKSSMSSSGSLLCPNGIYQQSGTEPLHLPTATINFLPLTTFHYQKFCMSSGPFS